MALICQNITRQVWLQSIEVHSLGNSYHSPSGTDEEEGIDASAFESSRD